MLAVFVKCSALSSMPKKEADWENINKKGQASMNEEKTERVRSLLTITKRSKRRRGVSLLLQKEKGLLT